MVKWKWEILGTYISFWRRVTCTWSSRNISAAVAYFFLKNNWWQDRFDVLKKHIIFHKLQLRICPTEESISIPATHWPWKLNSISAICSKNHFGSSPSRWTLCASWSLNTWVYRKTFVCSTLLQTRNCSIPLWFSRSVGCRYRNWFLCGADP